MSIKIIVHVNSNTLALGSCYVPFPVLVTLHHLTLIWSINHKVDIIGPFSALLKITLHVKNPTQSFLF